WVFAVDADDLVQALGECPNEAGERHQAGVLRHDLADRAGEEAETLRLAGDITSSLAGRTGEYVGDVPPVDPVDHLGAPAPTLLDTHLQLGEALPAGIDEDDHVRRPGAFYAGHPLADRHARIGEVLQLQPRVRGYDVVFSAVVDSVPAQTDQQGVPVVGRVDHYLDLGGDGIAAGVRNVIHDGLVAPRLERWS